LADEDPYDVGRLDVHPLVREYFGEQLRDQRKEAWQETNRRLYEHYRALATPLPESLRAMELLLVAVICGCQAGLYRDALHEIYWPRIQRGDASFAAKVLGARGALLSVLATFSKTVIGGRPCNGASRDRILRPKISYSSSCRPSHSFRQPEASPPLRHESGRGGLVSFA